MIFTSSGVGVTGFMNISPYSSTKGALEALAKCLIIPTDDTHSLNQRICVFRNSKINVKLLYYLINRNPYLLSFNNGENQTNLRKNDILKMRLSYPTNEAEVEFVLKRLDEQINLINELIENGEIFALYPFGRQTKKKIINVKDNIKYLLSYQSKKMSFDDEYFEYMVCSMLNEIKVENVLEQIRRFIICLKLDSEIDLDYCYEEIYCIHKYSLCRVATFCGLSECLCGVE